MTKPIADVFLTKFKVDIVLSEQGCLKPGLRHDRRNFYPQKRRSERGCNGRR